MTTSPIDVACPNCQAKPGDRCTQPDSLGRHEVKRVHYAREQAAQDHDREPEHHAPQSPALRLASAIVDAIAEDASAMSLECECGHDVSLSSETTAEQVRALIEHAAFDHATRRDISVHRVSLLVSRYELGLALVLPSQTEAEAAWRVEKGVSRD